MKWFLFTHAVATKIATRNPGDAPIGQAEPSARPFFGVHLVNTKTVPLVAWCGDASATLVTTDGEPRGFMSACCACLARSELAHV